MLRLDAISSRSAGGPGARPLQSWLLWSGAVMGVMGAMPALAEEAPKPERAGGAVGVGFILGDVNGLSLKYWGNPTSGFQVRLGSASQLNSVELVATYDYHFRPVEVADHTYSLPFYVGAGFRFNAVSAATTHLDGGLAGVVGMSVLVPDLPIEIFVEVRPVAVLYNDNVGVTGEVDLGFQVEGGMGVNYYF